MSESEVPAAAPETNGQAAPQSEPEVKVKKTKKQAPKVKSGERIQVDPKDYDLYQVPEAKDEGNAYFDAKVKNPVPDGLVHSLADHDWDETQAASVKRAKDGTLWVEHGQTRWRALPKANALRRKAGLPPVRPWVIVTDEDDSIEGAQATIMRTLRLNNDVQDVDPVTLAENLVRAASAGVDEKTLAKIESVGSVEKLHGLFALHSFLNDTEKCPESFKEHVRDGTVSMAAAMELIRKSEKLSKGELDKAVQQVATMAAGGVRITAEKAKQAAGGANEDKPATRREKLQALIDLSASDKLTGKFSGPTRDAAMVAIELAIGTRTLAQFWTAIGKISKGQPVKVSLKQYAESLDKGKTQE